MPADLIATIALTASSVLFGLVLPLTSGIAVIGIVRALIDRRWWMLCAGLLLTIGVIAAGVWLRTWAVQQAGEAGVGAEQLAAANRTAAVVFTAVTPAGVVLGVVLVAVSLVSRYVMRRRREG